MAHSNAASITPDDAAENLELDATARRFLRISSQSIAFAVALSGCSGHADADLPTSSPEPPKAEASQPESRVKVPKHKAEEPRREGRTTLIGVRISQGNAVACAEIRTDDGTIHPVSGLTGAVAIGDRIAVTGRFGVSVSCVGRVLIIENTKRL